MATENRDNEMVKEPRRDWKHNRCQRNAGIIKTQSMTTKIYADVNQADWSLCENTTINKSTIKWKHQWQKMSLTVKNTLNNQHFYT